MIDSILSNITSINNSKNLAFDFNNTRSRSYKNFDFKNKIICLIIALIKLQITAITINHKQV